MNEEYDIPQTNKRNIPLLSLGLILAALLVAVVYYETKVNRPASSDSRGVGLVVAKGQRTHDIADQLATEKIISRPTVFLIYAKLHGASDKIQAGEYSLNTGMTIPEIVDVLTHGKVVRTDRNITFIEGMTNKQIAQLLVDRQVTTSLSGLDKALGEQGTDFKFFDDAKKFAYQGFLFPDTYTISSQATATDLVHKMLKNFESKVTTQMVADIDSQHRTLGQIIILASIIEKEVGRNQTTLTADDLAAMQKERTEVASVFYNRLVAGMPLESDATVNYITGKQDRSVSILDTKIKSAYNTYQVRGLPPGPISNPGLGSIMAAIYPSKSNYLYFLNAPDGTAYFAATLAQHNANRAKYLK